MNKSVYVIYWSGWKCRSFLRECKKIPCHKIELLFPHFKLKIEKNSLPLHSSKLFLRIKYNGICKFIKTFQLSFCSIFATVIIFYYGCQLLLRVWFLLILYLMLHHSISLFMIFSSKNLRKMKTNQTSVFMIKITRRICNGSKAAEINRNPPLIITVLPLGQ